MAAPTEAERATIDEFQAKRREFQPRWNRAVLLVFLPGFLLFGAGGPGGLLFGDGKENNIPWLLFPGIALCVAGLARGLWLAHLYLRCPRCDAFQRPAWQLPYRSCDRCGARLSEGVKDSA